MVANSEPRRVTPPRIEAAGGPLPHQEGTLHRLAMYALLAFLFMKYSRITDDWSAVLPGFSLGNLSLPFITSTFAFVVVIATGGLRRALGSRAGFFLSAFSVWLVCGVPFSFWKFGSFVLWRTSPLGTLSTSESGPRQG